MVLAFDTEKVNTPNKFLLDFGQKTIKTTLLLENAETKTLSFQNTLFFISDTKVKVLKRDFKDAISVESGIFTKQEIESAQLLLQAEERFVDISNEEHITKAYQNFFEQLSLQIPFDFRDEGINFDQWSVFVSISFISDLSTCIQIHLNYLKSMGFIFIRPFDHLTASFLSQSSLIGKENIKHKYGILVNVNDQTEVGIFDEELISDGTIQIPLGTASVVEYGLAYLRDLAIRGFKRDLVEEWVFDAGTCKNDAPSQIKSIRRKSIDIKPILNSPRILFDFQATTNMRLEPNSIQEGIISLLSKKNKKIKKNISKILSNVLVVGQGATYKGFAEVLKSKLQESFPKSSVYVQIGIEPNDSEINGLNEYLKLEEVQEVFNVTKIKLSDHERKALEKQYSSQIKVINGYLKEMKNKKVYYPDSFGRFVQEMRILLEEISGLPEVLIALIETTILKEVQKWSKDFAKQLTRFKKLSQKGYDEANQSLKALNNLSSSIAQLQKQWLIQTFFSPVTRIKNEIQAVRSKHELKINSRNLKIVNKVLAKNKSDWFLLDDLSQVTGIPYSFLIKINSDILSSNPEYGYLDQRLVLFSQEILEKANTFFLSLISSVENRTGIEDIIELKADLEQGLEYANFLIRGYSFFNQRFMAQEILAKKEYLLDQKRGTEFSL